MLTSLHIENIAVIRSADLDFGKGFSALTGETGAGKSMIVDSINLLLGNRISREIIRSGEMSATVSAVFEELSDAACKHIREMGFEVLDSSANFVFARHPAVDGMDIYTELKARNILVRHFTAERICQFNRITIGTREQMDALLSALADILTEREAKA